MKEIILASKSERRTCILSECGIVHSIVVSNVEEIIEDGRGVSEIVQMNAAIKAEKVAEDSKNAIVIGADTLVVHGDNIIGKPEHEEAALKLLRAFSGTDVFVYTGICVIDVSSGKKASGFEESELSVRALSEDRLNKFFSLMAPYDKAGGFSIEGVGSLLFDNIRGSYFNILGLPMMKLAKLFEEINEDILDYVNK